MDYQRREREREREREKDQHYSHMKPDHEIVIEDYGDSCMEQPIVVQSVLVGLRVAALTEISLNSKAGDREE
jgi:hypothetical protein